MNKKIIDKYKGVEEREIFRKHHIHIQNSLFNGPGESPVKECTDVLVTNTTFNARYAGWEDKDITFKNCHFTRICRAPIWYTKKIILDTCILTSPKALRECDYVTIRNTSINGIETMWQIRHFDIDTLKFQSYYPFLECAHGKITNMTMIGKYSFQHCHDIIIENSNLDTKDAFWHSHDITIKNSVVKGEYLAWYSHDLTFVNCQIIGTQPFVGANRIRFEHCDFAADTDRAFEDSTASGSLIHLPCSIYDPKNIDFTYEKGKEPQVYLDKTNCKYKFTKIRK